MNFNSLSLCTLCSFFYPLISSLSLITGPYSQSAAIQLKGKFDGDDHHAEVLLLSRPGTPTPPNHDPPRIPLHPARKQVIEHELGPTISDPIPGPSKRMMEGLEGSEIVRVGTGVSKIAEQGNRGGGGGVSSYYRPTRRGSPRPSTHNDFDINEHLPWMIVLLLLLVLVVIVVCSVKRSSRVLKKGPMQDPSSIMEKAIQKKPPAASTQIKERWIYYTNGQGKPAFLFYLKRKKKSFRMCKTCGETAIPHKWLTHL